MQGFEALLRKIDETLPLDPVSECMFRFPAGEGAPLHLLHEHAQVTSTRYSDEICEVEATVPESIKRRLKKYLVRYSGYAVPAYPHILRLVRFHPRGERWPRLGYDFRRG